MSERIEKAIKRLRNDQLIAIVVVVLLVLALTVLSLLNYSTFDPQIGRYRKALQAENYTEAGRFFAEDIRGDLALERMAQGLVVRQIESLKEAYVEREIDVTKMTSALEEMRAAKLLTDSVLIDLAQADVEVLTRSLDAFEQARQAELGGDIAEAIRLYTQVQLLDPNYDETQVRLVELRGRYIRQAEQEINRLIAEDSYAKAMTLIAESEQLMPGEATWTEKRVEVDRAQQAASIDAILELSLVERSERQYEKALARLKQASEIYPDRAEILQAYLDTRDAAESDYLNQARHAWSTGNKAQALLIIDEGLSILADNPYLMTWQRIYEQAEPLMDDEINQDGIE